MKKLLPLFVLLLLASTGSLRAQHIFDGYAWDSTTIHFDGTPIHGYIADTGSSPLWQIGRTHKSFFTSDSSGQLAIMTDTLNTYPVNANRSFTLKVAKATNLIIDFWHKYQTATGRDGGIVEYSKDHGATWDNVKGSCNTDSSFGWAAGVVTSNFYTHSDTLANGQPGFSGTQSAERYSRVQFLDPQPIRTTSGGCTFWIDTVYIRFRFISDSSADSLAGWMIDSMKIENDRYEGLVGTVKQETLHIAPNPSLDGHFTFPALNDGDEYTISIYNALGQRVLAQPYKQSLDLSHYINGLYFYSATNGSVTYTGRLLKE